MIDEILKDDFSKTSKDLAYSEKNDEKSKYNIQNSINCEEELELISKRFLTESIKEKLLIL